MLTYQKISKLKKMISINTKYSIINSQLIVVYCHQHNHFLKQTRPQLRSNPQQIIFICLIAQNFASFLIDHIVIIIPPQPPEMTRDVILISQSIQLQNQQTQKMSKETYNLTDVQTNFKKIQSDKKKSTLKPTELILELNKNLQIDHILVREAFKAYPQAGDLEKTKTYKPYELFFNYLIENIDSIEQAYLKSSQDQELIQKTKNQNQKEYNFLLNKNSISQFVRDEATYYQQTVDKYLESTGTETEKGIRTQKMHLFLIELFGNKYTQIVKDHSFYFNQPKEEIAVEIGKILASYAQEVKEMTSEQSSNQFFINQEEILQFLTFWIKQEQNSTLFVLYARTNSRLQRESRVLLNKSMMQLKTHPSRMTKNEIETLQKEQMTQQAHQQQISTEEKENQLPEEKVEAKTEEKQFRGKQDVNNWNSIQLAKSKIEEESQEYRQAVTPIKRQLTKYQKLMKTTKKLYEFGCKRRHLLSKNTTFDNIQQQLVTMNLQKFMYFCHFFQIPSLIPKHELTSYFKHHAINQLKIDYPRFLKIIQIITKQKEEVIDHLLNKHRFEQKIKHNQIKHDLKLQGKISKYKFKLRPVNGKDITSIKKELEYRKLEKTIEKEEKQHQALVKRQKVEYNTKVEQNNQNGQNNHKIRSVSHLSYSKVSKADRLLAKQPYFNPERLISQEKDQDHLWDAYEASIWKKQQKTSNNILHSILSKRINKGNSIISKINSQRSLLYE